MKQIILKLQYKLFGKTASKIFWKIYTVLDLGCGGGVGAGAWSSLPIGDVRHLPTAQNFGVAVDQKLAQHILQIINTSHMIVMWHRSSPFEIRDHVITSVLSQTLIWSAFIPSPKSH